MTDPLEHFGLERSPFADEPHAAGVIGTRALRKLVARIQAALRDGGARIGVCGVAGIGKSSLAAALPKLFAGNTRVATLLDPADQTWPDVRVGLARDWQLAGERLSRASLIEASRGHRLVLVIDRAEEVPEALLGHLDVLQDIRDENGAAVVTVILFVQTSDEEPRTRPPALRWLERSEAALLRFEPLAPDSVVDYIERRLRRSGYRGAPLFTPRAALAIHAETAGVPGAVSRLCEQLLVDAAARRLRSIDEPFVRSRQQTPRALAALVADDVDHAWDDADHHPRETVATELLLEQAIGAPVPRPTLAAVPSAGPGEAVATDPELEAYLSAPPTEAELRAIRGGFVRRSLWPFALASGAVVLGGLLLALLLGGGAKAPTDEGPSPDMDPAVARALRPEARPDPRLDPRLGSPIDDPGASDGSGAPPILGRIRGPAPPSAPAAAPAGVPSKSPTPSRIPRATPTPAPNRAGEAMAGGGGTLVPAGELDRELAPSPAQTVTEDDGTVSDERDFRPPDLVAPARIDDSDL
ncbi:MAG: hypothetical protein IPK00_10590 [Deltaproteobacteria bacterium]|nr:hypothetical protein [Deltaproteobacteria bacterium]